MKIFFNELEVDPKIVCQDIEWLLNQIKKRNKFGFLTGINLMDKELAKSTRNERIIRLLKLGTIEMSKGRILFDTYKCTHREYCVHKETALVLFLMCSYLCGYDNKDRKKLRRRGIEKIDITDLVNTFLSFEDINELLTVYKNIDNEYLNAFYLHLSLETINEVRRILIMYQDIINNNSNCLLPLLNKIRNSKSEEYSNISSYYVFPSYPVYIAGEVAEIIPEQILHSNNKKTKITMNEEDIYQFEFEDIKNNEIQIPYSIYEKFNKTNLMTLRPVTIELSSEELKLLEQPFSHKEMCFAFAKFLYFNSPYFKEIDNLVNELSTYQKVSLFRPKVHLNINKNFITLKVTGRQINSFGNEKKKLRLNVLEKQYGEKFNSFDIHTCAPTILRLLSYNKFNKNNSLKKEIVNRRLLKSNYGEVSFVKEEDIKETINRVLNCEFMLDYDKYIATAKRTNTVLFLDKYNHSKLISTIKEFCGEWKIWMQVETILESIFELRICLDILRNGGKVENVCDEFFYTIGDKEFNKYLGIEAKSIIKFMKDNFPKYERVRRNNIVSNTDKIIAIKYYLNSITTKGVYFKPDITILNEQNNVLIKMDKRNRKYYMGIARCLGLYYPYFDKYIGKNICETDLSNSLNIICSFIDTNHINPIMFDTYFENAIKRLDPEEFSDSLFDTIFKIRNMIQSAKIKLLPPSELKYYGRDMRW